MAMSRRDRRALAKKNGVPFVPIEQTKPVFAYVKSPVNGAEYKIQSNANLDETPTQIARCRKESFHLRNSVEKT